MPDSFRRFRAPKEDGQALIDPAWPDLPGLAQANRRHLAACAYDFHGESLTDLRETARSDLAAAAVAYSKSYEDPLACDPSAPLMLAGHQPELFHPGVWFKNFALSRLAAECGGAGVHLIIDSDIHRDATLRVPAGTIGAPRAGAVPIDAPQDARPHEERAVADIETLNNVPARVQAAIGGLIPNPLIHDHWPDVLDAARRTGNLGLALSQGRHALESQWGLRSLELPLSHVADTPSFRRFAAHLVLHGEAFRASYNQALADYRAARRIRNAAQPIPDLRGRDGWVEAPLWVWREEEPVRRALYVRKAGDGLELSDLAGGHWKLSAQPDGSLDSAVEQLESLRKAGVKIRPRALTTTLYARLMLADLFLHGIGGALYDQVADLVAERFFGFAPPPHATLSATLLLPIPHNHAEPGEPSSLRQRMRALRFHPETLVDVSDATVARLVALKRQWVNTPKTPSNAKQRHDAINGVNVALQPYLRRERRRVESRLSQAPGKIRDAAVLESREYAYCLYPESSLRPRLMGLLDG